MNITPAKNKDGDGIVMTCMTQYLRSWNISINGRSPVLIEDYVPKNVSTNNLFYTQTEHLFSFST